MAPSVELAERFDRIMAHQRQGFGFLENFFEDEPKWRARLKSWIAKTLNRPER